MPIHDWTRLEAGSFHAFHAFWIADIARVLNGGILPKGYYAGPEQVISRTERDVVTFTTLSAAQTTYATGGLAVAEVTPRVQVSGRPSPSRRPIRQSALRKQVVIRHVSDHRVVSLIEVVSPSNKDRDPSVQELTKKLIHCLESGIHAAVLDLLPPGPHDPGGIHGAIWAHYDTEPYIVPEDRPLTLVSYAWDGQEPTFYLEPTAVGRVLADVPIFLTRDRFVNLPTETAYLMSYAAMGEPLREILEAQ